VVAPDCAQFKSKYKLPSLSMAPFALLKTPSPFTFSSVVVVILIFDPLLTNSPYAKRKSAKAQRRLLIIMFLMFIAIVFKNK